VLNPTGTRENLFVFLLPYGDDLAFVVEDACAGTGRPLVNREDVLVCQG
jgi:hypothetical protein